MTPSLFGVSLMQHTLWHFVKGEVQMKAQYGPATIMTGDIYGIFDLTNVVSATDQILEKCELDPSDY